MQDNEKLNLILKKLQAIEEHLGLKTKPKPKPETGSKSIYDDMEVGYTVKDTAKILGCSINKVRKLQNIGALTSYMIGRQKMIASSKVLQLLLTV